MLENVPVKAVEPFGANVNQHQHCANGDRQVDGRCDRNALPTKGSCGQKIDFQLDAGREKHRQNHRPDDGALAAARLGVVEMVVMVMAVADNIGNNENQTQNSQHGGRHPMGDFGVTARQFESRQTDEHAHHNGARNVRRANERRGVQRLAHCPALTLADGHNGQPMVGDGGVDKAQKQTTRYYLPHQRLEFE